MFVGATTELQPSRRLPPPEAWKEPERYIDLTTGLILPGVEKLVLPTDDRGFVITNQSVRYVLDSLLQSDYGWTYHQDDPLTRPDNHHFYFDAFEYTPSENDGSDIPIRFRELPTMIGRMPRQLHNVFHDLTLKPEMPEIDAMKEYIDSYDLAYRAFKKLFETAKDTVAAQRLFLKRRKSVATGAVVPIDPYDSIGEKYMRSFFEEHFEAYSRAIDALTEIDNTSVMYPGEINVNKLKPHLVVSKFGRVVTRRCVDYMPLFVSR
jgi:hypothetical protein